jgi:hypothetical protein
MASPSVRGRLPVPALGLYGGGLDQRLFPQGNLPHVLRDLCQEFEVGAVQGLVAC